MGSGGFDSDDDGSPVVIQGYKLNVGKKRLKQVRRASSLTHGKSQISLRTFTFSSSPLLHTENQIKLDSRNNEVPAPRNAFAAL